MLSSLSLPPRSCAFNCVLHEKEEEDVKSWEQPQLLEQRHHHGLLQQARRGAAQRDSHSGEWGTKHQRTEMKKRSLDVSLSARCLLISLETTRQSSAQSFTSACLRACWSRDWILQKEKITVGFSLGLLVSAFYSSSTWRCGRIWSLCCQYKCFFFF